MTPASLDWTFLRIFIKPCSWARKHPNMHLHLPIPMKPGLESIWSLALRLREIKASLILKLTKSTCNKDQQRTYYDNVIKNRLPSSQSIFLFSLDEIWSRQPLSMQAVLHLPHSQSFSYQCHQFQCSQQPHFRFPHLSFWLSRCCFHPVHYCSHDHSPLHFHPHHSLQHYFLLALQMHLMIHIAELSFSVRDHDLIGDLLQLFPTSWDPSL